MSRKKNAQCKTTITLDDLTDSLGLERMENVWDRLSDSGDAYGYAYDEALKEAEEGGLSEEDAEEAATEAALEAERQEQDEEANKYFSALESAAESLYGHHKLMITIPTKMVGKGEDRQEVRLWDEIKVEPSETWRDAAAEIMETINGVGTFTFYSLKEFLDSGRHTPCEAVMTHLHWIERHPEVYGGLSAQSMVEHSMRYNNPSKKTPNTTAPRTNTEPRGTRAANPGVPPTTPSLLMGRLKF